MHQENATTVLLITLVLALTVGLAAGYWFEGFMQDLARPFALGLL